MRMAGILAASAGVILIFAACEDKSMSKKVGEKAGSTIRNFTEGAAAAIDDQRTIQPTALEGFRKSGLECTIARTSGNLDNRTTVEIYIISALPVRGCVRLKAMNADHREIGRADLIKEFKADSAGYEKFLLPKEMSLSDAKFFEMDFFPETGK